MRRKWPLAVVPACVTLVVLSAFQPAGHPLGWQQATEGNEYRTDEYGMFGVTFYQRSKPVPGLDVSPDCRAALRAAGLRNPPEVEVQMGRADRTIRRGGTQYWLRIEVETAPKDVIAVYAKQITKSRRIPTPGGVDEIAGLAPDGKTPVRVYAAKLGNGKTDVSLTFGPGSA